MTDDFEAMINKHAMTLTKHNDSKVVKQRDNSHLKQYEWKPGQSGNPNGRPPLDVSVTSKIKELLTQDSGDGKTYRDLVAEALLKLSISGDTRAIAALKELLDRSDGKVTQPLEVEQSVILHLLPPGERE